MPLRCLFHVHTHHSFDSILSPRAIIASAREAQVDVLIVTDHNTLQGSRDVQALANGSPSLVVLAAEYQSEKGDIIGIFLTNEITSRRSDEILRQVHEQGGLAVLPHPFKGHTLDDALLRQIDLIEVHNSRCSDADNLRARHLAEERRLPFLAGADAHCKFELRASFNDFSATEPSTDAAFRRHLLNSPRQLHTRRTPTFCRPYSQMVKAVKTRSPRLFLSQAKQLVRGLGKRRDP